MSVGQVENQMSVTTTFNCCSFQPFPGRWDLFVKIISAVGLLLVAIGAVSLGHHILPFPAAVSIIIVGTLVNFPFLSRYFNCSYNSVTHERGSDNILTRTEKISSPAPYVHISGPGKLVIRQGDTPGVSITTDANIIESIDMHLNSDTLYLGPKEHTSISTTTLSYEVTIPSLKKLVSTGSCEIEVDNLQEETFTAILTGSTKLCIKAGKISSQQNVQICGSGKYHSFNVESKTTEVNITGSGEARVYATERLNINVEGSGSVFYKGTPLIYEQRFGSRD